MAVKMLTEDDFDDFISSGNVIIDFYADWCGPCKIMAPHFQKASEEIKNVKFGKIDVDAESDIAQRFQIMSIPTSIFFKDGEQVDRHTGALSFDMIKEKVETDF